MLPVVPVLQYCNIAVRVQPDSLSACEVQLSNANTLSAYLLGSGSDPRKLPIARTFQSEVVSDSADTMRRLASDHGSWLQGNCQRQVSAYRHVGTPYKSACASCMSTCWHEQQALALVLHAARPPGNAVCFHTQLCLITRSCCVASLNTQWQMWYRCCDSGVHTTMHESAMTSSTLHAGHLRKTESGS